MIGTLTLIFVMAHGKKLLTVQVVIIIMVFTDLFAPKVMSFPR